MDNGLILQLLTGVSVGLGAGYIGSFMVLRRMSLVGDALSHVALPGIAVALLLEINPFVGAFAALVLSIVILWGLERRTALPSETLVGILFTVSLAIGLLLTPEPELLEALFGDISRVGAFDLVLSAVLVALSFVLTSRITRSLILGIISKDLARSMKIDINKVNFVFLFTVAVIVALGLKVAGTLLMGALVIIPAAAAKNVSPNLGKYTLLASSIGGVSALAGIWVANNFGILPGPTVVLTGGLIFLATLVFKK